jgi:hypothetical protein
VLKNHNFIEYASHEFEKVSERQLARMSRTRPTNIFILLNINAAIQ